MAVNKIRVKIEMDYADYKTYVDGVAEHTFLGKHDLIEKEALKVALKNNPEYQSLKRNGAGVLR